MKMCKKNCFVLKKDENDLDHFQKENRFISEQ